MLTLSTLGGWQTHFTDENTKSHSRSRMSDFEQEWSAGSLEEGKALQEIRQVWTKAQDWG